MYIGSDTNHIKEQAFTPPPPNKIDVVGPIQFDSTTTGQVFMVFAVIEL